MGVEMIIFGPVSNAVHGDGIGPWFPMVVGSCGIAYSWFRYSFSEATKRPGRLVMAWITFICLVLISYGLWDIVHK